MASGKANRKVSFKFVEYTHAYSVTAGSTTSISKTNLGISNPTGYSPIGIQSFQTGNSEVVVSRIDFSTDTNFFVVKNTSGSDKSPTAKVILIYIPSEYVES